MNRFIRVFVRSPLGLAALGLAALGLAALGLAALGLAASMSLIVLATPATAQARLDARYAATLAGIPIGKGAWVIDISGSQFTAAASGATSGLLKVFSTGQGSSASRGPIVGGNPVPATFAASITTDRKTEEIRITLVAGDVKDYTITPTPPVPDHDERIPLTDEHRRGVTDPMTGLLIRVPGNGNPVGAQACQRTVQVFDGRLRYTLSLAYKRMEQVKTEKGYEGPAVVCAVYFTPIAGHTPNRASIKYLAAQRDMEVWLAPVANTRVLVAYRLSIPTPVGLGVLQATQFVAVEQPVATTASTPKTR